MFSWLEEPLNPYDTVGYGLLSESSSIPIAAGEAVTLIEEYENLLKDGRIQVVQPDLGRVGGITGGKQIAALAQVTGAWTVPHAFGTGVLLRRVRPMGCLFRKADDRIHARTVSVGARPS